MAVINNVTLNVETYGYGYISGHTKNENTPVNNIIAENHKVTNDYFWKSNEATEKDIFGRDLDLTALINKPDGYLKGTLSDIWDVDYYRFSVAEYKMLSAASDKYNLDITITLDHIPEGCDYELVLYDADGNQVGIGTDNGEGGKSITIPNWNMDNKSYTVKVQAKDGSPVNDEEYYHLSFRTKQADKKSSAYEQAQKMSEYAGELRRKLHEGLDATEEMEALRSIKDEYAAYYAEQMDKLHNEQAKEYLQGGEVPSKEQIDELLKRMAAGDTLTEQEKGLVNIYATAQEIDAAKAGAELNTTLKEEIFSQLEETGIELPISDFEFKIGLNGKVVVTRIEDQAAKQTVENVLNRFADKLSEIYFTTNAGIQQMSKREQYILKSAQDVERFLQKATGSKATLADITVENGRIKGLPGNLDMLLNNPGQNRTYEDYRDEILAIKNYEQIYGSGLLEQFSAGYVISGKDILIK